MAAPIEIKAKANGLSKPQGKQFKIWLIGKLTEIAMAQQATVDAPTLEYFAGMLAVFDPQDILPATSYFCHRERVQGETAFPSLPMIEGKVTEFKNARLIAERKERERQDESIQAKHIADHPEEYIHFKDFGELLKILRERKAAK